MGGHRYSSLLVCYPRRVGGHGYSLLVCLLPEARVGLLVCLLPEARVGGHGYSSLLVCLFVCNKYIYSPGCHSAAFTAWIGFTQQYLGLNSGRF